MLKNSKYQKNIWETSTLSVRIISWILNIDIILNNSTFDFKKNFLNSIVTQSNHLKKNIRFEKNFLKKIEILTAIILSGLVFKEYETNFQIGVKELEAFVKNVFDNNGFPLSRNPNDLLFNSTGAKPFISIGKKIKKGETLMIIEAMKTMNHVPSTSDGIVKKICVDDGQPVEFGQTIATID